MIEQSVRSINHGHRSEDEWREIIWRVTRVRDLYQPEGCALIQNAEHLVGWERELNVSKSSMYQPCGNGQGAASGGESDSLTVALVLRS